MDIDSTLLNGSSISVLLSGVFLFLFKKNERRNAEDMREVRKIAQNAQSDAARVDGCVKDLRIHVTENFSNRLETNAAIARVHDQIEKMGDDVARRIDTLQANVRQDIQTLIDRRD